MSSTTSWDTTTSNGDWGTSTNWTNGIPTSTTDVNFNISAPNISIAQSEQYAKSITFTDNISNDFQILGDTLTSGVSINKLTVSEHITNSGNKNIYIGHPHQKVQINFYKISTDLTETTSYTINNEGTGTIQFYEPILVNATSPNVLYIYGSIVFDKGIIMTTQSTLNINNDFLYLYGQVTLGTINLDTNATLHIGYDVLFTDIPNITGTGRFYLDSDNTFDLNLIPGQTIETGKLTVDGSFSTTLTLGSNSTITMNIVDDNTYDEIGMEGSVVLDGSLNLHFSGAIGLETSIVLFPGRTTFGGTFISVNASGHYGNLTFTKNNHIWSSTSTSSSTYFTFDEHTGTLNQIELIPSIVGLTGPSSVTQGVVNQYTATVKYEVSDFPVVISNTTQKIVSDDSLGSFIIEFVEGTYNNFSQLSDSLIVKDINNNYLFNLFSLDSITNNKINFESQNKNYFDAFMLPLNPFSDVTIFNIMTNKYKYSPYDWHSQNRTYLSGSFSTFNDASGNVDLYIDGSLNQTKPLDASGSATFDVSFNSSPSASVKAVYQAQGILDASESQVLNVTVIGSLTPYISILPTKIYDGSNNVSDILTIDLSGINSSFPNVSATYTTATYNDKNVGLNKSITISGITLNDSDSSHYQLSTNTITTTGTIIRKDVSANFMVQDKIYDGTVEAIIVDTPTIHGKLESDSLSLVLSKAEFLDANVGTDKLVVATLPYELSGDDFQNYNLISHPTSTADINVRDVSGSFIVYEKEYDGTVEVQVSGAPIVNGKVFDDDVSLVIRSAESVSANVGSNIQVVVSGYDLSGGTANNYRIETPITSYVNIVPRDVSGSFIVYEKEYDGTVQVQVSGAPIVNGKVFDDDVSLVITSAEFDNENVGVGKSVTATAYDLSGGTANNYRIISAPVTTGVIYARDVSGSFTVLDKVYDGSTGATISSMSLTRVLPSDDIGLTGTAYFITQNIGSNEVRLFNASLTGDDVSNYNLVDVASTTGLIYDIDGIILLQSIHSSYHYGDVIQLRTIIQNQFDQTGSVSYYQVKNGTETLIPNGSSLSLNNSISLLDISGLISGTYEFVSKYTLTNGTTFDSDIISIQINKKIISASIQVLDKDYDGTTNATILSNNGIVGSLMSDGVSIQISSVSFENSSAGVNKRIEGVYELQGSNLSSYDLSLPITRATIRRLDISGTFVPSTKVYDSNTSTIFSRTNVNFSGILPIDVSQVSVSMGTANYLDPNVGTNKPAILSGQLTGAKANNYNFIGAYGFGTIVMAYLVCNAKISDRQYNGTRNATVSSVSSKIRLANGTLVDVPSVDVSSIVYNFTATFDDENVGVNKPITIKGLIRHQNYFLFSVDASGATVTKKDIQGLVQTSRQYNGGVSVSNFTKELIGVENIDIGNVNFDVSGVRYSSQDVGVHPLTIDNYTIFGSRAFNYNIVVSGVGTITARPVVPSFPPLIKVYDGTTGASFPSSPVLLAGTDDGRVFSKDINFVSFAYDSVHFMDTNAEVNKALTVVGPRLVPGVSGDRTNNYMLGPFSVFGTIQPKDISGSFYAANKVYDGTKSVIYDKDSLELYGVFSFDSNLVAVIVKDIFFDTADAGEDKIVSGTLPNVYLTGTQSKNYNLVSFTSVATIYPKIVEVKFSALDKYFDKTDIADVSNVSFTGVYESDISNVFVDISMAFFEDALIGENKFVFVESLDISGSKKDNYEIVVGNSFANILRPVTMIEPKISYEEIYLGMDYKKKFVAIGNKPFVYDVSFGRLPNGLAMVGDEISGNVTESGVFNFVVIASIPNIFDDKKLFTLRVKPLVTIRQQKIFPLSTIDLPSGSRFDFLDPQLKTHIQEVGLVYGEGWITFGNSIFDIGIQTSIDKATQYRYIFEVVDNPKRFIFSVDYMIIFKVFDEYGNLISRLPTELPLSIYLDNARNKHIDLYVANNPQTIAGSGDYKQRLGSKYKFECNIHRGDGVILVYLSNNSLDGMDSGMIKVFDHLEQVDRFLLSDYMTTPQLYVENNFNDKMDEWKMFVESKFPDRIGSKKLSEL
jgi:hypothetical protein